MFYKLITNLKNTWKYQTVSFIFISSVFLSLFFPIKALNDDGNLSFMKNANSRIVDEITVSLEILGTFLSYGEAFSNKFNLYESNWNDFINLSGIQSISKYFTIDELRIHYNINNTNKEKYEQFMTAQLNRPIILSQVTDDNKFVSEVYDNYCPLTYISPNTSKVLYNYIGVDICHVSTYKLFTTELNSSKDIKLQSRKIIRDNSNIIDIGKSTPTGFVVISLLITKLIPRIHEIPGNYFLEIANENVVLFSDINKDIEYYPFYNSIEIYNTSISCDVYFIEDVDNTYIIYLLSGFFILLFSFSYIIIYYHNNEGIKIQLKKYEYSNELLGYINHELRNPLNSVQGLIHITLDDISSKNSNESKDYIISNLKTAEKACIMMNHIVNDILDMTKLQKNKLKLHIETVNPLDIYEDIRRILLNKAQEYPDIKLEFSSNIDFINVDKYRITQILLNFILNSYKFTDSGFIKVSLTEDNGYKYLSVKDSGPGVNKNQIDRLFKPYEQNDISDSIRHGGMGLGLYICKMLSDLMEFEIGYEDLNPGANFYIKFI